MSVLVEQLLANHDIGEAIKQCSVESMPALGALLAASAGTCPITYTPSSSPTLTSPAKPVNENESPPAEVEETFHEIEPQPSSPVKPVDESKPEGELENFPVSSTTNAHIRVIIYSNFGSPTDMVKHWNRMSKGCSTWNGIQVVDKGHVDYFVVINCPPTGVEPDLSKTIYFQMDPLLLHNESEYGTWANPPADKLLYCGTHASAPNLAEWHLAKTYTELSNTHPVKTKGNALTAIVSDAYATQSQVKRVDFLKHLEETCPDLELHTFGGDNKFEWKNFMGSLPSHVNDSALMPYKYAFVIEDVLKSNYFSEKLVDAILSECLVFYNGPINIRTHFDPGCMVWLDLASFRSDTKKIRDAIEGNLWEEKYDKIQEAKRQILEEMSLFPRLEKIISEHNK